MKKNHSFFKQLINIGFGTIVTLLIGFIATPIITRLVEPEVYGSFSLFNTYTTLGVAFLTIGLDQAYVRYFFSVDEHSCRNVLFRKCIFSALVIDIVFYIVLIIIKCCGGFSLPNGIIVLYIINLLVQIVYRFYMIDLRVHYYTKFYSFMNCFNKATYVILTIIFVKCIIFQDYYGLVFSILLSNTSSLLLVFVHRQNKAHTDECNKKSGNEISIILLLKYGIPLMFSTAIFSVMQSCDRIELSLFCDKTTIGIYASAQAIMTILSIIQNTFNTVWAPRAIEAYEKGEGTNDYYKTMNNYVAFAMFSFGIVFLMAKNLIIMFLGSKYRDAMYIIPFLVCNPVMYTLSETTYIGIAIKKKSIYEVYIMLSACILNILLNYILIGAFGVKGAAVATGISYVFFFWLRTIVSERLMDIGFNKIRIIICTAILLLNCTINTWIESVFFQYLVGVLSLLSFTLLYKNTLIQIIGYMKNFIISTRRKRQDEL